MEDIWKVGPAAIFAADLNRMWDATVLIVDTKLGTSWWNRQIDPICGEDQLGCPDEHPETNGCRAGHWPCEQATLDCRRRRRAEVHGRDSSNTADSILTHAQDYMMMKILADLGKYKSVACNYVTATGTARFATAVTHVLELDRLLLRESHDLVAIDTCSITGWVHDLCC